LRKGITVLELFVVLSIIIFLSATLYQVLRSIGEQWIRGRNRLDILMTTRIIMAAIRNDLRNAIEKPTATIIDKKHILYIPVKDKADETKEKVMIYLFDEEKRKLFRGEKPEMGAQDQPLSDTKAWHSYLFDDGQILKFEYDNSYRDSDSFAESELTLDSKVWFKVTMKILYTEKFKSLSDAEREKIANDPNDPRLKTFFVMITPRRINWLLQATQ